MHQHQPPANAPKYHCPPYSSEYFSNSPEPYSPHSHRHAFIAMEASDHLPALWHSLETNFVEEVLTFVPVPEVVADSSDGKPVENSSVTFYEAAFRHLLNIHPA